MSADFDLSRAFKGRGAEAWALRDPPTPTPVEGQ